MRDRTNVNIQSLVILGLAFALAFVQPTAHAAEAETNDTEVTTLVVGVQGTSVDAEEGRDGRYTKYRDDPDGFLVDYLRVARLSDDGSMYLDLRAIDAGQNDEQYLLRAGSKDCFRLRFRYNEIPFAFGNNGRFVLDRVGPGEFRIADFIQQQLEDPDGNGIPFFSEPGGVGGDNSLVQSMFRGLAGSEPFDVAQKRRTADLDLKFPISTNWNLGVGYRRSESRGIKPLGNAAYQRITDVDGDGSTDYDYFFSLRGLELPATIDYTTTQTTGSAAYRNDRWFGEARLVLSEFENENPSMLYDNPFWFSDTQGSSGVRRGLWEESRVSMPPSNEAWNVALSGGGKLGENTRLTFQYTMGEHSQNEPFVPITTNTVLVGTKDLNGDGIVDAQDDPTSLSALPQSSLDATVDTTVMSAAVTSRPTDTIKLKAHFRSYEYDGGNKTLLIPARAEYNDSRLKTDMKGSDLLFIPYYYKHTRTGVEGVFDLGDDFKLALSADQNSYNWNRYTDLGSEGSFTRDIGNRSVAGNDDDTLGLVLRWKGNGKVDGSLGFSTSERRINGEHQIAFAGQEENLRQYDIADRDRDAFQLKLNFHPNDTTTLGVHWRDSDDSYPDAVYGWTATAEQALGFDANFGVNDTTNVFLYVETTEFDADVHLRTKCSNCSPPAGADWQAPWGVPNFDWFTDYTDKGFAAGIGLEFRSDDEKNRFDVEANYNDAEISNLNQNPGLPVDLGKASTPIAPVALAVDFPDQTNTFASAELRYIRRLREDLSWGVTYLYEDWDLTDFQVQQLQEYGADFLGVDDATRYLTLDSWIGSYDANVVQTFFIVHLD